MTDQEKEIIMKNFNKMYIMQGIQTILILAVGLLAFGTYQRTELLVQQANKDTIKEIKATADGISSNNLEGWSMEYITGTYSNCNRAEELGVVEECKIIGEYLEEQNG